MTYTVIEINNVYSQTILVRNMSLQKYVTSVKIPPRGKKWYSLVPISLKNNISPPGSSKRVKIIAREKFARHIFTRNILAMCRPVSRYK